MKKFDDLSQEDWKHMLNEGVGGGASINEVACALVTLVREVNDKTSFEDQIHITLSLIQGLLSIKEEV